MEGNCPSSMRKIFLFCLTLSLFVLSLGFFGWFFDDLSNLGRNWCEFKVHFKTNAQRKKAITVNVYPIFRFKMRGNCNSDRGFVVTISFSRLKTSGMQL